MRRYGKANKRHVLCMADAMADEAKVAMAPSNIPDWAGLAWIVSPYYNYAAHTVCNRMGPVWTARAGRLCLALDIACVAS